MVYFLEENRGNIQKQMKRIVHMRFKIVLVLFLQKALSHPKNKMDGSDNGSDDLLADGTLWMAENCMDGQNR